jgi:hypothetical protein
MPAMRVETPILGDIVYGCKVASVVGMNEWRGDEETTR